MSDADLAVTGGRVFVHGKCRDVTLGVTDGRVSHLTNSDATLSADRMLDVDGDLVLPGCVDAHVHVRPGDDREGVDSATAAAAAGGVTTVVDMPNFPPTVTDRERWDETAALYDGDARVDYSMFGHIAEGQNVGTGDVADLADAGAPAYKTFLSAGGGPDPYVVRDKGDLLTAFEEVAETGRPFWIHAEDDEYHVEFIERVEEQGVEGMDAFLESAPPILETTAVRDLVDLADYTGVTTVIAHTTTADALDIVADAQADGVPIYAETTPYYLGIDAERLKDIGTTGLGTPPVRSPENRERIWDCFNDGRVDTMATDHAPRFDEEKDRDPIDVGPGMPQLETALPLLLTGVNDGRTTVERVVETYARRPAELLGLPRKGSLEIGSDADFVAVDMDAEWTVDPDDFESRAKYSPFDGWTFTARPTHTFVRGREVAVDMAATDATPGERVEAEE
jgi:allantoinase